MSKEPKYDAPKFITNRETAKKYPVWLQRKAQTHVKRDRERGYMNISVASYKQLIHEAVVNSNGYDAYTNEKLSWNLIGTWNNEESKKQREEYLRKFALLPSVDHELPSAKKGKFKICAWRTNDAKGYLSTKEFLALCKSVMKNEKHIN
jgi:hypothetical protein